MLVVAVLRAVAAAVGAVVGVLSGGAGAVASFADVAAAAGGECAVPVAIGAGGAVLGGGG